MTSIDLSSISCTKITLHLKRIEPLAMTAPETAIGGQIILYPTHSLIFLQSKLKFPKNFSFIPSSLPLLDNKSFGLKGIFPLHLICQKSTSIAYYLILNGSVASAHPACGDLVSASAQPVLPSILHTCPPQRSCVAESFATG